MTREGFIPCNETDDAGAQQKTAKAAKNPADDLAQSAFRRWRNPVSTELPGTALCLRGLKPGLRRHRQPAKRLIDGHMVPIELRQVWAKGTKEESAFFESARTEGRSRPLTAPLDPFPPLWSDFLLCSKCKLSVRNSMGRRAEGCTVGACMESVLRVMRVTSPAWSRRGLL